MKKGLLILALFLLLLVAGYFGTRKAMPQEFPGRDVFALNLSCEEQLALGETATIDVSFSNKGKKDYTIASRAGLYEVLVNDKIISENGEGRSTRLFSHGSTQGTTYTVVPDKPGLYQVKATVILDVMLSLDETKEYSYEKTASFRVTA